MSKQFLAVGDHLINPALLSYAIFEQGAAEPRIRLGFGARANDPQGELRLSGDAAREVVRWLRLNAVFLSTTGGFGTIGSPAKHSSEVASGGTGSSANDAVVECWSQLDISQPGSAGRFSVAPAT